jgi:hypothetical protein
MGAPPTCEAGPYGAEDLFFGAPEAYDSVLPAAFGDAHQSPDGLRMMGRTGGFQQREYYRASLDADWGTFYEGGIYYELEMHLFGQNLFLYSGHGGSHKAAVYIRATAAQAFGYDATKYFVEQPMFSGTAHDVAFTPTPDGLLVAFSSSRVSAADDTAQAGDAAGTDLWLMEPIAPAQPQNGFSNLQRLALASGPDLDVPEWISDDGRTLIFRSIRPGSSSVDLYVSSRASMAQSFGAAVKIAALSDTVADELAFSLPSIAAIQELGGSACAYFLRVPAPNMHQWYRVPVCLGAAVR